MKKDKDNESLIDGRPLSSFLTSRMRVQGCSALLLASLPSVTTSLFIHSGTKMKNSKGKRIFGGVQVLMKKLREKRGEFRLNQIKFQTLRSYSSVILFTLQVQVWGRKHLRIRFYVPE